MDVLSSIHVYISRDMKKVTIGILAIQIGILAIKIIIKIIIFLNSFITICLKNFFQPI